MKKIITALLLLITVTAIHGDRWVRAEALVLGDSIIKHIVQGDTVLVYKKPQYDGTDEWVKQAGLKNGVTIKRQPFPCKAKVILLNSEKWNYSIFQNI